MVYEAGNYGIYDMTWIEDSMRVAINSDKFNILFSLVSNKISEIPEAQQKAEISIVAPQEELTKRDVVKVLYDILANYEYSTSIGLENKDAVTYMTDIGVIKGDGKDLGLDNPCTIETAIIMAKRAVENTY